MLSHPLCGASHSVQSRCSISFPYPMIPSHGPSSNRFKSAFAECARVPLFHFGMRGELRLSVKIGSNSRAIDIDPAMPLNRTKTI